MTHDQEHVLSIIYDGPERKCGSELDKLLMVWKDTNKEKLVEDFGHIPSLTEMKERSVEEGITLAQLHSRYKLAKK